MIAQYLPGRHFFGGDPDETVTQLKQWLIEESRIAISQRGQFRIALAGGSTPKALYEQLAADGDSIDWYKTLVFFGDERACPADDPSSNYAMIDRALLSHVAIRPEHVYRIRGEADDLIAEATRYTRVLELVLGRPPVFDVVLLGLGANGHTASLFPGTAALDSPAWCTVGRADYEPFDRITLTFSTINAAREVAFLITGEGKGEAIRATVAQGTVAAAVNPTQGKVNWFLDDAAVASAGGPGSGQTV